MSQKQKSVEVGGVTKTVGEQLGEGAEGRVYAIKGDSSSALKIFNEDVRDEKEPKIRAMLKDSNRPEDPVDEFHSIVWPQTAVEDDGEFLGYQMPRLDLDEWDSALVYQMSELSGSSLRQQLRPAYNLAFMVHNIHKEGHALGDFNHDNILVRDGYISLIDCDGFHIKAGKRIHEGETFLKRYSPPEKRPKKLDEVREADKFCLAVHVFQFLMEGYHPYAATGPDAVGGNWDDKIEENHFPYTDSAVGYEPPEDGLQQKYDKLPQDLKDLFENCFSESSTGLGWGRTSAEEWVNTLGRTDALDVPEDQLPGGSSGEDDDWTKKTGRVFSEGGSESGSNTTTGTATDDDDDDGGSDWTDESGEVFD